MEINGTNDNGKIAENKDMRTKTESMRSSFQRSSERSCEAVTNPFYQTSRRHFT